MILPEFVKAGDPIKASNINALVSAARNTRRTSFPDPGTVARKWRPFDVIDVNKDASGWLIRVQPGFFITGATASSVLADDATTSTEKPLTNFPDILVEEDKNLYFKYSQRKLIWETPEAAAPNADLLLLVSFTVNDEGTELSFTNHHPAPIYAKAVVPFAVTVAKVGEVFKATVAPGYVRNLLPMQDVDAVYDAMPTMDGTPLDSTPSPTIEVADGDWLYVKVETDSKNKFTSTPEIIVGDADTRTDSHHYQPESPEPEDGVYYFPLASIAIAGDVATITQRQAGGPIVVLPNLLEFEHVGGKREVFRRLRKEDSVYEFRTLENAGDDGEEIIKPLEEDEEEMDKETIPFRRLRKGPLDQIKVKASDDKDAIIIEGNGYTKASSTGVKSISVYDGLVIEVQDSEGLTCNVVIRDCDANPLAEPPFPGTQILKLTFEDGLLVSVNDDDESSEFTATVQSCCWIDDPSNDDWRGGS